MRRPIHFLFIFSMLVSIPKSSLSQDWTTIPLTDCGLGDSTIVDLGAYGGYGTTLIIKFLQTDELSKSGLFSTQSDIAAFFIKTTDDNPTMRLGEFRLWNSISGYHIEDFDRNGKLDVYIKAHTGGNGMYAAVGGVYEVSVNEYEQWQVDEIMFFDSEPEAFDIDADGLWEFTYTDELWTFATAHSSAARFWPRFFKPDTLNSGYYLANSELEPSLVDHIATLIESYEEQVSYFKQSPTRRAAYLCVLKGEIVLAWCLTLPEEERIFNWLSRLESDFKDIYPLFSQESLDFLTIRQDLIQDMKKSQNTHLPTREPGY